MLKTVIHIQTTGNKKDMAKSSVKFSNDFLKGYIHRDNIKEVRAEMSKLASVANKRLQRLENAGLDTSPAYKKWVEDGQVKFGVKGKNHNELQRELSRLKNFINAETSTIRGVNNVLKDMAKNTGIKYKNLTELRSKANNFFELADKVEQYLRTVDDIASAIGYQKIWEAINSYVQTEKVELDSSETDIESLVANVTDLLTATNNKPINGYSNDPDGWWFD